MARRRFSDSPVVDDQHLPVVALIGRPNVGKSSLFNRLIGGRPALVEDVPGVTRDRRYGTTTWNRARFRVVDTGGLDPSADGILGAMRTQTLRAVDEGAVLVLVIDVTQGATAADHDVARLLRRTGKPIVVAVNKVDSRNRDADAAEGFSLRFDDVFPVSAVHGRGIGDMLDRILELLSPADLATARAAARPPEDVIPDENESAPDADADGGDNDDGDPDGDVEFAPFEQPEPEEIVRPIRLAFVGKPNVGKSSLVNRLLGDDRVLVHDEPGTTRDPIDTPFRVGERDFVLVDTAGLRRRRTIESYTEAISAIMSRDQLARADVAALVIDARQGATAEDAKLASFIEESGRAALIVFNKTDLVPRAQLETMVAITKKALGFIAFAPILRTSAITGRGVSDLTTEAAKAFGQWSRRVPTAALNKHFGQIVEHRPPPAGSGGRHVKMYFATQAETCPPTFFISTNWPKAVAEPYRRYLINQFRKVYGFEGSPLRVSLREHRRKKKGPNAVPEPADMGAGRPTERKLELDAAAAASAAAQTAAAEAMQGTGETFDNEIDDFDGE